MRRKAAPIWTHQIKMEFFEVWQDSNSLPIFAILILIALFYWLLKFQDRLNLRWKEALLIAVAHVVIGWSAMRLLAILEAGGNIKEAANMRLYGAIFLLPVLYYIWAKRTKRDILLTLDVAAICVIFGAVSGRLNCLTSGCCKGIPIYFGLEIRWPLRELELIYYAVFIVIYGMRIFRKKTHGEVYGIYLITYGALRFLSEFVRAEHTGNIGFLHLAHIWSLLAIATGAVMYYIVRKKDKTRRETPKESEIARFKKEEK